MTLLLDAVLIFDFFFLSLWKVKKKKDKASWQTKSFGLKLELQKSDSFILLTL